MTKPTISSFIGDHRLQS